MPCQPLPLQPLEWFNPTYGVQYVTASPPCRRDRDRRKRSSTDSQNCSPQSSDSMDPPGSPGDGDVDMDGEGEGEGEVVVGGEVDGDADEDVERVGDEEVADGDCGVEVDVDAMAAAMPAMVNGVDEYAMYSHALTHAHAHAHAHTQAQQHAHAPAYMYPGTYMFGPPIYNMNGINVQGAPQLPQSIDNSGSKRRKKKRRRRRRRGGVDDGSEETSSDDKDLEEPVSLTSQESSQEVESDSKHSAGSVSCPTAISSTELPDRTPNSISLSPSPSPQNVSEEKTVCSKTNALVTEIYENPIKLEPLQNELHKLAQNSHLDSKCQKNLVISSTCITEKLSNDIGTISNNSDSAQCLLQTNVCSPDTELSVKSDRIQTNDHFLTDGEPSGNESKILVGKLPLQSSKALISESEDKNAECQNSSTKEKKRSKKSKNIQKQKHQQALQNGFDEFQVTNNVQRNSNIVTKMDGNEKLNILNSSKSTNVKSKLSASSAPSETKSDAPETSSSPVSSSSSSSSSVKSDGRTSDVHTCTMPNPLEVRTREHKQECYLHKDLSSSLVEKHDVPHEIPPTVPLDLSSNVFTTSPDINKQGDNFTEEKQILSKVKSNISPETISSYAQKENKQSLPSKLLSETDSTKTCSCQVKPLSPEFSKASLSENTKKGHTGTKSIRVAEQSKAQQLPDEHICSNSLTTNMKSLDSDLKNVALQKECSGYHVKENLPKSVFYEASETLTPPVPPPRRKKWQLSQKSTVEQPVAVGIEVNSSKSKEVCNDEFSSSSSSLESEESVIDLLSTSISNTKLQYKQIEEKEVAPLSKDSEKSPEFQKQRELSSQTSGVSNLKTGSESKREEKTLENIQKVNENIQLENFQSIPMTQGNSDITSMVHILESHMKGDQPTHMHPNVQEDTTNNIIHNVVLVSTAAAEKLGHEIMETVLHEALLTAATMTKPCQMHHLSITEAVTRWLHSQDKDEILTVPPLLQQRAGVVVDDDDDDDDDNDTETDGEEINLTGPKNVHRNPLPALSCNHIHKHDIAGIRVANSNETYSNKNKESGNVFNNIGDGDGSIDAPTEQFHLAFGEKENKENIEKYYVDSNLKENILVYEKEKTNNETQAKIIGSNNSSYDHVSVTEECDSSSLKSENSADWECDPDLLSPQIALLTNNNIESNTTFEYNDMKCSYMCDPTLSVAKYYRLGVPPEKEITKRDTTCYSKESCYKNDDDYYDNDDEYNEGDEHDHCYIDKLVTNGEVSNSGDGIGTNGAVDSSDTLQYDSIHDNDESGEEIDALVHFKDELDSYSSGSSIDIVHVPKLFKTVSKAKEEHKTEMNKDHTEVFNSNIAVDSGIQSEESGNEDGSRYTKNSTRSLSQRVGLLRHKSFLVKRLNSESPFPCGGVCCILQ